MDSVLLRNFMDDQGKNIAKETFGWEVNVKGTKGLISLDEGCNENDTSMLNWLLNIFELCAS
jgi:hypothetical protein